MDNNAIFSQLSTEEEVKTDGATSNANTAARKQKLELMKKEMEQSIKEDPAILERLHTLSNSIEVVNSLGFGDSGNIVQDKKATGRDLLATSAIVGYRVKNTGKTPVKYMTELWAKGTDGKYVGEKTEKVLSPGGTADLTRQYMTMFCAMDEIAFVLANGKIVRGSASTKLDDPKHELEAHYFLFNKGEAKQINSDEVKLNVGVKDAAGKWIVKPEFEPTFGYLNNPKETAKGGKKSSGEKISTAAMAANYIKKMAANSTL